MTATSSRIVQLVDQRWQRRKRIGYGIRFRTPSKTGRSISAVNSSILLIVGPCMEQKNRTLDTALGMERALRLNEIRLKVYRPESYENGRKSCVSGRRLVHRETQRPVRLYFIASWVHSSSAHSQSFKHNFFATNEHGVVKP